MPDVLTVTSPTGAGALGHGRTTVRPALAAMIVLLTALSLAPVWSVALPPLADYPNHLARMHILAELERSATLQQFYDVLIAAQPNLAMDLIVPALARVMPLEVAGKVFISLTLISMAAGVLVLHRTLHDRWSWWPCLAFLFLYNRLFLWGFLGYLLTLGLALAAVALWIRLRDRPVPLRLATGTVLATLIYLGHLYAFGVYALIIAGYELDRLIRRWPGERGAALASALVAGLCFVPPVLVFLLVSPTAQHADAFAWAPFLRKLELPFSLLANYHLWFDALCSAALIALFAVGLIRGSVVVKRCLGIGLILLAAACLVMPDKLFSSYGADRRIPIAFVLLLVAASDWRIASAAWRRALATGIAVLFVVRMGLIFGQWQATDRVYAEFLAAIDQVPHGARLMSVIAINGWQSLPPVPLNEIAGMAVVRRDAFVPNLFAYPLHAAQTISFVGPYAAMARATPSQILMIDDADGPGEDEFFRPRLMRFYDYVLIGNVPAWTGTIPAGLETVAATGHLRLLRVDRDMFQSSASSEE